jgi:hypothetical protein
VPKEPAALDHMGSDNKGDLRQYND